MALKCLGSFQGQGFLLFIRGSGTYSSPHPSGSLPSVGVGVKKKVDCPRRESSKECLEEINGK